MAISTHAPAGGATAGTSASGETEPTFLLTPLREGRRPLALDHQVGLVISTHAPAGGATPPTTERRTSTAYFYSRPCGRGDCTGSSCMGT